MWKLLLGLALGYTLYSKPKEGYTKPKEEDSISDEELEKQTDDIIWKDDVVQVPEMPDVDDQYEDIIWKDRDLGDILLEEGFSQEEVDAMLESLEVGE